MKKIICIISILSLFLQSPVYAVYNSAGAAYVIDYVTGDSAYAKNENERMPMASTTKIMTAALAIENGNMEDIVTVSENAAAQEGSSAYLEAGDQLTLLDLLYGLMLNSGNDAAVAIAEHIAGGTDAFSDMMNHKAWELGLTDTQFTNPNGLPSEYHYTTAHDLALIARYAMSMPVFREIVSTSYHEMYIINRNTLSPLSNHNRLLKEYEGCIGIKTGYTNAAGRCLVSAATRDNMTFIAVTLNDPDDWADHKNMLDEAFSEYSPKKLAAAGETVKYTGLSAVYGSDFYVPKKRGSTIKTETVLHVPSSIKAPVQKGDKLGYAEFIVNGESVGQADIYADISIYKNWGLGNECVRRFESIVKRLLF